MQNAPVPASNPYDRQRVSVETKAKPVQITRKVRDAIHAMVWEGLKRADAATKAGIKDNSLYIALRRPDVKAYYLAELDVLRTSERARNIHALVEVRDDSGNAMARVQAVKTLEQISDEAGGNRSSAAPAGITIVVQAGTSLTQPPMRVIENADGSST